MRAYVIDCAHVCIHFENTVFSLTCHRTRSQLPPKIPTVRAPTKKNFHKNPLIHKQIAIRLVPQSFNSNRTEPKTVAYSGSKARSHSQLAHANEHPKFPRTHAHASTHTRQQHESTEPTVKQLPAVRRVCVSIASDALECTEPPIHMA